MSGKIATWEFLKNNFWEGRLNDNVPQTKQCVSYEKLLDNYNVEEISGKSLKQLVRENEVVLGNVIRWIPFNNTRTVSLKKILNSPNSQYILYFRGDIISNNIFLNFIKQLDRLPNDTIKCSIKIVETDNNGINELDVPVLTYTSTKNNPDKLYEYLNTSDIYYKFYESDDYLDKKFKIVFEIKNTLSEINQFKSDSTLKDSNFMVGIFNQHQFKFQQAFYNLNTHIEKHGQFNFIDYRNRSSLNPIRNINKQNGISKYITLRKYSSESTGDYKSDAKLPEYWSIDEETSDNTQANNGILHFIIYKKMFIRKAFLSFRNITDNKFYEFMRFTKIPTQHSLEDFNITPIIYSNYDWNQKLNEYGYKSLPSFIVNCYSLYITKNGSNIEIWILFTFKELLLTSNQTPPKIYKKLIYSFSADTIKVIDDFLFLESDMIYNEIGDKSWNFYFKDTILNNQNLDSYFKWNNSGKLVNNRVISYPFKFNFSNISRYSSSNENNEGKLICSIFPIRTMPNTLRENFTFIDVYNF